MAIIEVTIGSLTNFHAYEDGTHPFAIDSDGAGRLGTAPSAADEIVRLGDIAPAIEDLLNDQLSMSFFLARIY